MSESDKQVTVKLTIGDRDYMLTGTPEEVAEAINTTGNKSNIHQFPPRGIFAQPSRGASNV